MTAAQQWGKALRAEMRRKSVTGQWLADTIGTSRASVYQWRAGRWFPEYISALRVADALDSEHLRGLAQRLRTRTCEHCGREFVATGKGTPGRWCSKRCRSHRWTIRRNRVRSDERRERNGRELAVYRRAVEAMCKACEPEGLCRLATCELRSVSPLRLADERVRVA